VLLTWFHNYNGAICIAAPLYWWSHVSIAPKVLVQMEGKKWQNVSILIRFGATVLAAPVMCSVVFTTCMVSKSAKIMVLLTQKNILKGKVVLTVSSTITNCLTIAN
jgi:hypothetical protein